MACKNDATYAAIRAQLVRGELRAGERVSEQSLAEQLGVSRSPVREAIKRLQRDGYFQQVHRYGTIVRQPDLDEVTHAYQLREALEPYALLHTPPSRYAPSLGELAELCRQLIPLAEAALEDPDPASSVARSQAFFRNDQRFHELLLHCGGNTRFQALVADARLFAQIHGVRRHSVITFETVMGVYRFHQHIVDAIAQQDMPRASQHMAEHLRQSREGAEDWLRFQARRLDADPPSPPPDPTAEPDDPGPAGAD